MIELTAAGSPARNETTIPIRKEKKVSGPQRFQFTFEAYQLRTPSKSTCEGSIQRAYHTNFTRTKLKAINKEDSHWSNQFMRPRTQ